MKARVKATGEIVEVKIDYRQDADYISTSGQLYWQRELDFYVENKEPDYWTRLEHQYAGMAMQGMLNNSLLTTGLLKAGKSHEDFVDEVTRTALRYAHTLVEKLKEKEERK